MTEKELGPIRKERERFLTQALQIMQELRKDTGLGEVSYYRQLLTTDIVCTGILGCLKGTKQGTRKYEKLVVRTKLGSYQIDNKWP